MKKLVPFSIIATVFLFGGLVMSHEALAQTDNHTAREEAEGGIVWQKLQSGEVECSDLPDEDFGVLGEYFMGQMLGDSHAAMNEMMMQIHGEEGEEQIHVVTGKRLSGCDTSASFPMSSGGWMPVMNMMWGGWPSLDSNFSNNTNNMMNFGYGFGFFGWIFMILFWVLVIMGIVALGRWLSNQSRGGTSNKSALDILKERYARGEIDKHEFEEKKKELS
jgi:putative membrane protein